jgi:catecholate siderophore receptor
VRDTGSQSREIFAIESIEVSKGPNSAIGGAARPAAASTW